MPKRTPDQIRDETLAEFIKDAKEKFDKGQLEHGGNLDERVTFKDPKQEAIDFVFYTYTLHRKTEERVKELEKQVEFYKELARR
jgi:hypothetical protein